MCKKFTLHYLCKHTHVYHIRCDADLLGPSKSFTSTTEMEKESAGTMIRCWKCRQMDAQAENISPEGVDQGVVS